MRLRLAWPEYVMGGVLLVELMFMAFVLFASWGDWRYFAQKRDIFIGLFVWTIIPPWVLLRYIDLVLAGPARRRKAYRHIRLVP